MKKRNFRTKVRKRKEFGEISFALPDAVNQPRSGVKRSKKTKVVDDLIVDMSTFSSSTQLMEKRKELAETQRELQETRVEVDKTITKIKQSEKDLQAKRTELQNNVIALDKFIVENERRKSKAIENKKKEQEELEKCVVEIGETKKKIKEKEMELKRKTEDLKNNFKQYYEYLQSVVIQRYGQASPEDVKQIMKKHENLKNTHNQLRDFVMKKKIEYEEEKQKAKKYINKERNEQIKLNNTIAILTRELEEWKLEITRQQSKFDTYVSDVSKNKVTEGQIQMACQYLYNRVINAVKNLQRKNINQKVMLDDVTEELKQKKILEMLKIIRTHVTSFYEVCLEIEKIKKEKNKKKKKKKKGKDISKNYY